MATVLYLTKLKNHLTQNEQNEETRNFEKSIEIQKIGIFTAPFA